MDFAKLADFETPEVKKPAEKLDFKRGIIRVRDISKDMDHTFKHGKARGETTHITQVNPCFTWKRGELTAVTGWPQHGKTEFTLFLMLMKSINDGWRWIVYSPENHPAGELFDTLIHTYIGQSVDPAYRDQMTKGQYDKGKEFIDEHFIYVYPPETRSPEVIREYVAYIVGQERIDGTLKDPWNKLVHVYSCREDQYLASQFPLEQAQAREHNLCSIITAHPKGAGRMQKGEPLPVPDQYWLAGGQMWDNMFDNILCLYRPDYHINKASTLTRFISHKIKKQKLVGIPGEVEFDFERKSNRYLFDGQSPIVRPGLQPDYMWKDLPASDFENQREPNF